MQFTESKAEELVLSETPSSCGIAPSCEEAAPPPPVIHPTRLRLFFSCLGDVLLPLGATLIVALIGALAWFAIWDDHAVQRTDRWSFKSAPANSQSLLHWGNSQRGITNFRVERPEKGNDLVLRYSRDRSLGPAAPPWESWGYTTPHLAESSAGGRDQESNKPKPVSYWLCIIAATLAAGAVAVRRIGVARMAGIALIPLSAAPRRGWWRSLLLALLATAAVNLIVSAIGERLHLNTAKHIPSDLAAVSHASFWQLALIVAAVAVITPIAEECIFRGLVCGRYRAFGYTIAGPVVSTALFTLCHGGPTVYLAGVAGLGLIAAWLYQRTNSLWPPIALHALNNLVFILSIAR